MITSKKIISYTLYGNNPRYTQPLLINSEIIHEIYPGWIMIVYHDNTVDSRLLDLLKKNEAVTINILDTTFSSLPAKIWRFLPVLNMYNDLVIVRDSDSLLTKRERELVLEWEESDKPVHIIRDHPLHIAPILAGMFGIKNSQFKILSELIFNSQINSKVRPHDYDQVFLGDYFYPLVKNDSLIHVSYFRFWNEKSVQIKTPEYDQDFIGSVYNGDLVKSEKEKIMLNRAGFINGVPYSLAKVIRYRVRPTLYFSMLFNFCFQMKRTFQH